MRERVKALEDRNPVDQLACLILRVLAELSPCTERSLIGYVYDGRPRSYDGRPRSQKPGQASHSHARELVHSAVLKLTRLAFIEFSRERIFITDEGRRCMEDLPVVTLRQSDLKARKTKADRQVATAHGEQDGVKRTTKAKVTQRCLSSVSQLQARLCARHSTLLRALATTLRAEYAARLKRFCQYHLAQVRVAMPVFCQTIGRARDASPCVWKHKVALMIPSRATALVDVLIQFARSRARQSMRLFERTAEDKIGVRLSKVARELLPAIKFAGFDMSRSFNDRGALLLVCGALSIAGGVVFLSDEPANSSRAEEASFSGNLAGSSRLSPIVWFHDRQDSRSIFVTRRLAGVAWIEGLTIGGENASSQTLTGVQGTIKTDSGEEIKLSVYRESNQVKWADRSDLPSGSEFTLRYAVNLDGTQSGMPSEEFLSKYGGMIFRVSYAVAGVQTTLIEYFSTSKLRAQLADMH
jgi:hypothetical protein